MTKKPPEPVVRALIDESEIDESDLDAIVGGTGAAAPMPGGADSWSRAVQDHALVISAGATPSDRAAGSAVPPSVSAPSAAEPRALLPERASDEPLPDKAAPVVGPAVDDQVSALFDTSASSPPREVDEASKKKSQNGAS